MELYGLIGLASYCLVSLVLGVRLVTLARRTRELPECLIGAAFLCGGCFGYPALVISGELTDRGATPLAGILFYAGWVGLVTAALCLLWFWWRVYHPNFAVARGIALAGSAVLVVSLVGVVLAYAPGGDLVNNPWYLPILICQGGAYALNGWASARYSAMLRRRLALGLADPVIVNRILLWSLAAWAITLQYLYSVIHTVLTGTRVAGGGPTAIISSLGLVAAGTMVLAFFPPASYLRRVQRAGTSDPGS